MDSTADHLRNEGAVTDSESSELTRDVLFDGELAIWQRRQGYRFGLDALLLATDLPDLPKGATVVDLGAGQGVVALTIARRYPQARVVAVERQKSLLELLHRNIDENDLDNVSVMAGDIREYRDFLTPHIADLVVCNPPFYPTGQRRPSPIRERAEARHELHGDLGDFVAASAYVLDQRGWLQMLTPPIRMMDAMDAARDTDLRPVCLRFYHTGRDTDAYLIEYRWRRGGAPDFAVRPPLYIYQSEGIYAPEVAQRIGRERR